MVGVFLLLKSIRAEFLAGANSCGALLASVASEELGNTHTQNRWGEGEHHKTNSRTICVTEVQGYLKTSTVFLCNLVYKV